MEGFYKTKPASSRPRGLAYAPYADLIWCETGKPDLEFACASLPKASTRSSRQDAVL